MEGRVEAQGCATEALRELGCLKKACLSLTSSFRVDAKLVESWNVFNPLHV